MRHKSFHSNYLRKRYIFFLLIFVVFLYLFEYYVDKEIEILESKTIQKTEESNLGEMGELSYTNIYKANPISEEKIRQFFKADKIKVVIHIGPHKTGTTSIQKGIHDYKEIIARDGYVIPGEEDAPGKFQKLNPSHNIAFSLLQNRNFKGGKDREVFKALSAFLQRSKQEKKNVLLSSENFDMVDPKLMKMIFDDSFETHIVIVYRRYHEWLQSSHSQRLKGAYSTNYVTFVTNFVDKLKRKSSLGLKEAYGTFFENISILNYHEEKRLLDSFFCDSISGLNNTCQHVKNQVEEVRQNTRSKYAEFTQLIKLSKERNVTKKEVEEKEAGKQIQSFVHSTLNIETKDLPSKCIDNDVLDNIYGFSLNQEKTLFPVWFEARGGEDRFRKDFEKFYETSLCAIDSEAILEDERWVTFLGSGF